MRALSIFGKHVVTAETHPSVLFLQKVYFEKKILMPPIKKFLSCTLQECYNVTTPHYPSSVLLSVKWLLT